MNKNFTNHKFLLATSSLLIIGFLINPLTIFAHSGKKHGKEMLAVLLGVREDRKVKASDLRKMCERVSATIDNFAITKGLPLGDAGHRVYGHWGFSSDIPFKKEPLKSALDEVEIRKGKYARDIKVQEIRVTWHRDVKKMIAIVQGETGLPYKQAKALAGILYDIHLLGDWTGEKLEALQATKYITADIKKNVGKLFGKNSKIFAEVSNLINNSTSSCMRGASVCEAKGIFKALKNAENLRKKVSMLMPYKYPINSIVFSKKPAWKAELLQAMTRTRNINLKQKISRKVNAPKQAGFITGIVASGIYGYQALQGDLDTAEAAFKVAETSVLTAGSVYVSDAILIKMGDKYALQTIANSNVPKLCKAFGASANLGIATFIFDETQVIYNFMKGDISERQFIEETGKALIRTGGSYAATYCSVAIGLSASGPVVMFIAVGGYILADLAINKYQEYNQKQHLTLDDILIKVPFEIRNKTTIFDHHDIAKTTIHDIENAEGNTLYSLEEEERSTLYDTESNPKKSIFD